MKKKSMFFLIVGILLTSMSIQTAVAQSWSQSGNNASGISKLGTNNNYSLRFNTNSTQRMIIDSLGRVGINTLTPLNLLTVQLNGSTPSTDWLAGGSSLPVFLGFGENQATGFNLATAANSSGYRPVLNTRRSRGTLAAPTVVKINDYLASFVASGYDGSTFQNPATIDFYVDGVPSAGNVPGRISFVTGTNAANRVERLKVGNSGDFAFNENQLTITQFSGNVGINTAAPTARLQVIGGTGTGPVVQSITSYVGTSDVRAISSYSKPADGWGYGIEATGGYRGASFFGDGGAYTGFAYGVYASASGSAGTRYGVYGVASGGNENWGGYFPTKTYASELRIGGTQGATGYVAAINGKLIAEEVRVELRGNWPDYVFKKGYDLMTIEKLESKINADNHLPGIPAAKEIAKGGIMLGEMQTKTIEKLEENTLYIIQLNNKIKLLEKEKADENTTLNNRIMLLEKKIDELVKSKK